MKEHATDRENRPLSNDPVSARPEPLLSTGAHSDEISGLIELTEIVESFDLEREDTKTELTLFDGTFRDLSQSLDTETSEAALSGDAEEEVDKGAILNLFQLIDEPHSSASTTGLDSMEEDLIGSKDSDADAEPFVEGEPEQIIRLDHILNSERDAAPPFFGLVDSANDASAPDTDETPVTLTPTAIEKAIDHIIQTRYGSTIEKMIASTVEKVVVREMRELKDSLMKNGDDLDG